MHAVTSCFIITSQKFIMIREKGVYTRKTRTPLRVACKYFATISIKLLLELQASFKKSLMESLGGPATLLQKTQKGISLLFWHQAFDKYFQWMCANIVQEINSMLGNEL